MKKNRMPFVTPGFMVSDETNLPQRVLAELKAPRGEVFILNLDALRAAVDKKIQEAGHGKRLEFSAAIVEAATGAFRSQLCRWQAAGILKPSVVQAEGTGNINIYSRADIYNIAMFGRLAANGWTKRGAVQMMEHWQENDDSPACANGFLIVWENQEA